VPADVEPVVRAVRTLATYQQAKRSSSDVEAFLDELRDLTIEAEAAAEEGGEGSEQEGADVGIVRVAAATAFIEEGELEEALTTLGAGTGVKDLEWYVTI
jgi:coatomer subunit epsilon